MSESNKNLLIAFTLALAILFGWDYFVTKPMVEKQKAAQAELAKANPQAQQAPLPAGTPPPAPAASAPVVREAAVATAGRVKIETPVLNGSINLAGARLDDLTLTRYRETVERDADKVDLLSPSGTAQPYFIQAGWIAAPGSTVRVPGPDAVWQASAPTLTPQAPVTLSWDNGAGVTFQIIIGINEHYLFTLTQRVLNRSGAAVVVNPYALISRTRPDNLTNNYVLHEGPLGVFEALEEFKYKDLSEGDEPTRSFVSTGGWIGFTDKYWLTAIIPNQATQFRGTFKYTAGVPGRYQSDILQAAKTIAPGMQAETVSHIFAGAKEVRLIEGVKEQLGARLFDRAIDWGWFWYLTKPIFWTLDWLYHQVGNFGVAIILLTLVIKLLMFPLANKSYESMSRLKVLQPKMQELQERYKDDKERMQKALIEMYQKEKINPLGGCLPILLQIPVFFALYKVLFVTIEMRHQPFALWIRDLSAPDPLTPVNLFGLLPFTPPVWIGIGVLPIIMGITMWAQFKLSPSTITDPIQKRVFSLMPILFTFLMAPFSAGLILYWTVNNILSIAQQWYILKRVEAKEAKAKARTA